jgi:hypothetical protein
MVTGGIYADLIHRHNCQYVEHSTTSSKAVPPRYVAYKLAPLGKLRRGNAGALHYDIGNRRVGTNRSTNVAGDTVVAVGGLGD